ncbi:MAG: hypothetical protein HUU43_08215 [Ignavibacteriaceae bacterium]|nr:hypothetical protein [Ignavibacteriaceae bacterium]NUM70819.1 hypothetical protein [Ignavibacteriaceae bacterium]
MVLEIAEALVKEGITAGEFLSLSQKMQDEFLAKQEGFISRDLFRGENGVHGAVLKWESMDHALKAMSQAMNYPSVIGFASVFAEGSYSVKLVDVIASYE